MKKPGSSKLRPASRVALALTWDGARCPVRSLPPKARDFLSAPTSQAPTARKLARLFAVDEVKEIRICWVPQLKGGDTLTAPFQTSDGKRLPFHSIRTVAFGDILGVVYRRD